MENKYDKKYLIREIAHRASFTKGDVKSILDEFDQIIKELVAEGKRLDYYGLFHIDGITMKSSRYYNVGTKKYELSEGKKRLTIKPSKNLRRIYKEGKVGNYEDEEEEIESEEEEQEDWVEEDFTK